MTKLWEIVKDMKQIDEFRQVNHMVHTGRRRRVSQVRAFGTSDGAVRGWDSRGRAKGKNFEPKSSVVKKNKGYAEVNMADVLKFADKEKMKGMSNDEAYGHLMDAHGKAVKDLHNKGHEEVGNLNPSKIGDWVDSRFDMKTGYMGKGL